MEHTPERFVGLDIPKEYWVAAVVDKQQNVLCAPQRVNYSDLAQWRARFLQPTDRLVMEACSKAWTLCDELQPYVGQVVIAHAANVKLIASSLIKTDKRDALILARLLAADLIPAVWVPPQPVRE